MPDDRTREQEIAWAAGLFEGEGCWNAYRGRTGKVQMQVRLAMTDRDVVDRFAEVAGCGSVHIKRSTRVEEQDLWTWCVYEAAQVRKMVALFLPYLGERRRAKALEVLELGADVREHNGKRTHCPKGHPYEGDNLVLEYVGTGSNRHLARRCKACRTEQARERARKKRGTTPDRYRV